MKFARSYFEPCLVVVGVLSTIACGGSGNAAIGAAGMPGTGGVGSAGAEAVASAGESAAGDSSGGETAAGAAGGRAGASQGGGAGGVSHKGGQGGMSGRGASGGKGGSGIPLGGAPSVGAKPPMGWNSWNTFGCDNLNETLIKGVADTFVSSGMKDAGYEYVNLDDCWMNGRDSSGNIQVNASKFPSGMADLAAYIHDKGLKFGIYSTPGTKSCANIYNGYAGGVGSLGYEANDAQTYASWGVDYLKYDRCTADLSGFAVMRDALRATGRPIFYSINPGEASVGCVPGTCSIDLPSTANMWRIGSDIQANWASMLGLVDLNAPLAQYAGPGHWNDPDMLEVGKLATANEDRAHFSMWAIMAAPLLAGNDIRNMSAETKAILTNTEVIAVDQDSLGQQGTLADASGTDLQVWSKVLAGKDARAVVLLNRGGSDSSIKVTWSSLGLPAGAATVRDLWTHTDLGSFSDSYTSDPVSAHGVLVLKIVSGS